MFENDMKENEKTEIVVDETTVYEIDLECVQCMKKRQKEDKKPDKKRCRG